MGVLVVQGTSYRLRQINEAKKVLLDTTTKNWRSNRWDKFIYFFTAVVLSVSVCLLFLLR